MVFIEHHSHFNNCSNIDIHISLQQQHNSKKAKFPKNEFQCFESLKFCFESLMFKLLILKYNFGVIRLENESMFC